ncbi:MAG TPA: SLC13 family permease [Thermoanaerobaculia bacterium]|nr:SLC13 family permease [Thermoanaerobaculia bacterium]
MTGDILITLAITAGALALFLWNKLRVDVVGIVVMTALILSRLVTLREGISGFANEALLTVAAMFVLSAGLVRTGAIDLLGRWVARLAQKSELRLLAVSLALVIPLSAFINNTPVVVVMIPLLLGLSRKIGARPSKLLMPVSFASQLGGTLTLIGTSTNLLVAGLALELGVGRIGLFDITPPGLVMMGIGVVYLLTVGRWLTPIRRAAEDPIAAHELRDYVSVLRVEADSPLAGKSLAESRFATEYGLQVVAVDRDSGRIEVPGPGTVLRTGDGLVVRGKVTDLARIAGAAHLKISTPAAPGVSEEPALDPAPGAGAHTSAGTSAEADANATADSDAEGEAKAPDENLAELMVPPHSPVVGRTLRDLAFRARYGVPVLGIQRHGVTLVERMGEIALMAGDLLLVQGTPVELRRIHQWGDFALLGPMALPARRLHRLKFSVPILLGVVLFAALDVMPILVAAMLGVIAMFLTRCMTPEEAYQEVDWTVLVLLGSLIPLGIAMQKTGTAQLLANGVVSLTAPLGAAGTLAAFFLLTSLLTELISNNAAAVVLTPIAIATAAELGTSPLPFIIAVMFAASNSFMTPIGYQTNTFIFGPGGYRFSDFFRVGAPLNLLMLIAASVVIPWFFPF